jgi:hypothetical protein
MHFLSFVSPVVAILLIPGTVAVAHAGLGGDELPHEKQATADESRHPIPDLHQNATPYPGSRAASRI